MRGGWGAWEAVRGGGGGGSNSESEKELNEGLLAGKDGGTEGAREGDAHGRGGCARERGMRTGKSGKPLRGVWVCESKVQEVNWEGGTEPPQV